MKTRPSLAVLAIAAIALTAMGRIGTIVVVVNTASAENTIAGAVDTSNMTTFEENATSAGNKASSGGMTNSTG